jgi:N-methylhydantoinase A
VQQALAALDAGCTRLMAGEGIAPDSVAVRHFADLCYIGQGYHLEIPIRPMETGDASEPLAALYRDFLAAHDRVYGYAAQAPVRIVNLRAVHRVAPPLLTTAPSPVSDAAPSRPVQRQTRRVLIDPAIGFEIAAIYQRAALEVGQRFVGPAIVEQPDTTTLVPTGWCCRVEAGGILLLEPDVSKP